MSKRVILTVSGELYDEKFEREVTTATTAIFNLGDYLTTENEISSMVKFAKRHSNNAIKASASLAGYDDNMMPTNWYAVMNLVPESEECISIDFTRKGAEENETITAKSLKEAMKICAVDCLKN